MTALPTLDPELTDLGLAIGLLVPGGDGVELDSDWFGAPGEKLSGALADDARRSALVRFAEAVLAGGESEPAASGTTALVPLFDLRSLDPGLPDLVIQVSLDTAVPAYVEVGIVARLVTTAPATVTEVSVPLYRAALTSAPVAEPFALLAGGQVRLSVDLAVQDAPPAADEFGLAGVAVSVTTAFAGGPPPTFELVLRGLHLPDAPAATDVTIGAGQSIEDSLLSLVLGVVRQAADALTGAARDEVAAVLDLLGLGDRGGIPTLPVADLLERGTDALRDWFVAVLGTTEAREAWSGALAEVLGGTVGTDGAVTIPLGGGPVSARIGLTAVPGPSGHLLVTPRLGLVLAADVAGAVRLAARADVDVLTVDAASGSLTAVPAATFAVTATGSGADDAADLVHTDPLVVGSLDVGLQVLAGTPRFLLALRDVDVPGQHYEVLDLSTPEAAAAAAADAALAVVRAALDAALGAAAEHVEALIGLLPAGAAGTIDGARLLTDPLGALGAWWRALLDTGGAAVTGVLGHLLALIGGPVAGPAAVNGTGTAADPWTLRLVANRLDLLAWIADGTLLVAPAASVRTTDLGGGCTVITTSVQVVVAAIRLGEHGIDGVSFPLAVELAAKLRGTGTRSARLSLGPAAIVADHVGVRAVWSPATGLEVGLDLPGLALDAGGGATIPLALPRVDAAGHVDVPAEAWDGVEALLAVLAASAPAGWVADLAGLAGWRLPGAIASVPGPQLRLADLAADPVAALRAWGGALVTDPDLLGTLTVTVARLSGGSRAGLAGVFSGSGTPADPWLASLGPASALPSLAVWLGPDGPVLAPSNAGEALQRWRPGDPGLDPDGLAQAIADEARSDRSTAALAAGRPELGTGLAALAGRWAGTDGAVAPPPAEIAGLTVHTVADLTAAAVALLDPAALLPAGLPAGAVVVRVAITADPGTLPWPAAPGRLLDLTPPGLAPASFSVQAPAAGEWVVALAPRAAAALPTGDPGGVLGQAARLQAVVTALAAAGPVVLVAAGAAGHAARLVADAVPAVGHLVTLGTPWSAVTFDTVRTGVPGDALRLLAALLPPVDPAEPDDPDLATGRALVTGGLAAVRGAPSVADLEAPRPTSGIRAGLVVVAAFGALPADTVARALTAIVAAGLAARARGRAPLTAAAPTSSHVGVHVPFPTLTPPGGHGVTVDGGLLLTLVSADRATGAVTVTPSLRADLAVGHTDGWLVGGPGTTPVGGALPLELRRVGARVEVGLFGQPSATEIVLYEGSALGADWVELRAAPPATATGAVEATPLLPEAQAVLTALAAALPAAPAGSPAQLLHALLRASGLSTAAGGLLPDGLTHLLHDPGAQLRGLMAAPATRAALLDALTGLLPALSGGASDTVTLDLGPLRATADLGARTVALTAAGNEGTMRWQATGTVGPAGLASAALTLGDPALDPAALTATLAPGGVRVDLQRAAGLAAVPLWPAPDLDALVGLAAAAVPAEAVRTALEGLRRVDAGVGAAISDLAAAIGLLGPPGADGVRAVVAPVLLFIDPARWLRSAGVLAAVAGGPGQPDRVVDLAEGLKPFLGLAGTPRGTWPITPGVTVTVTPGTDGPALGLDIDATTWLAGLPGHPPAAAGLTASLTLPAAGAARPALDLYVGVPDQPDGTSSPEHRKTVHLQVGGTGVRVLLRPTAGSDLELHPHPAGFGQLLNALVGDVLPRALTEIAAMGGDAVRTEIATLVGAAGRGLAVATGTPAVFAGGPLRQLAADPAAWLLAHAPGLLTELVGGLGPVLQRLPGAPAASVTSAGVLQLTVRTVTVLVTPAPFAVAVAGDVAGLPVVDTVALSLAVDGTGVTGWSAAVGPAAVDVGGPVVRPVVRAAADRAAGWQVTVGLGLDDIDPGVDGHRELAARWRSSDGLAVIVDTRTAGVLNADTDPAAVAAAAVDAVLDLVGGFVLGIDEIKALLARPVGTGTVREVLEGSVLDPAAPVGSPELLPGVLGGWPGRLGILALHLAGVAPSVPIGPFTLGLARHGDLLGIVLSTAGADGLDLTSGGELSLRLEVDAGWIDPAVTPGVVVDLLRVSGPPASPTVAAAPGIEVNGIGLRLGRTSGPLVDAGLRLDTVAVHLFGSVVADPSGAAVLGGGIEVELGGLAVPLGGAGGNNAVAQGIMHDAGGSGAPPRPAFSPALAVQDHGPGTSVTVRAGTGDGPWFLPIQRAFGPVYVEQVGLGVSYAAGITPRQLEMISLYLDGQVSILGLTASVDRLRLGYHVSRPLFAATSWEVDVEGFAIASSIGGLTLAGGLRKAELTAPLSGVEYLGMLKVSYAGYGVDLFGGYAHPTSPDGSQFASFFAFGVLHAPIGGPPAFFITGIGVGFGINRHLTTPDIDHVGTSPFMVALRAGGPAPSPSAQLEQMRSQIGPARGEYWVAAGISFTSFVLVTGEILVTVQFGDGLEIAVLGLARALLPTADLALVSIELALLARFSSKEGTLLVQAQLTENSWLLTTSVRLTGGFAFQTWWKGPNAGQFVITVGGYHPRFHHDGYPVVPRVGLRWQPIDQVSVVGQTYFALCSEALMAGVDIEVAAHFGPAHARLSFGGDAIVFFDPFWFSVSAHADVEVGITIWLLFGSVDIDLHLGVGVEVSGPPIYVTGHFTVCGFEVPFEFGDRGDPADRALSAGDFAAKYLRADSDAQIVQATVLRGALTAGRAASGSGVARTPDGSAANPFRVVPEFQVTFVSTAPTETVTLAAPGSSKSVTRSVPALGIAPMYAATLDAALTLTFASDEAQSFDLDGVALATRAPAAFPKGVWGPAPNPQSPTVPAGDTVGAADGLTLDTALPASLFTGAPPVDYHQVELPLGGRKPLPFVTGTPGINARLTASAALKLAADVLTAGSPGTDDRFVRAATVLSAGGLGATSVAGLRGDRSAAPSFGSLADDLVRAPDPVSPEVEAVPVDRTPPVRPRTAPVVKSVLGVPHTLTLARAAGTTVADPGEAVSLPTPNLAAVRAKHLGASQAVLVLRPRTAAAVGKTVSAAGATPATRLASTAIAAVANAAPDPVAARRLATMSDRLGTDPVTSRTGGAVLQEGELAVLTVDGRPDGDDRDSVTVTGGATRVLCLAAGGRAVEDSVVGADGAPATVTLPRETERVAVVAVGDQAAAPGAAGTVAGWTSAQALPSVGWGAALAAGAVVTAQATHVPANAQRADGGWIPGHDLAVAAQVVTVFTDPVDVVAVVVDDPLGGDAAATLSFRLLDAERVAGADGASLPPEVLVDGVRSILLYAVRTTGPEPGVLVDGCGAGQLAGVLGGSTGVTSLAQTLATTGVDAAVGQPLVGGPGRRQVALTLAAGPVVVPKRAVRRRPTETAKKAAKKSTAKKSTAKKSTASTRRRPR